MSFYISGLYFDDTHPPQVDHPLVCGKLQAANKKGKNCTGS